ncbi:MAG: prepilin peptidase [Pseudomonadota bacterium]
MDTTALWLAFAALVPLMVYTSWHDLKYLTIPNWISLACVGIYVATASWGLAFETFLWGLGGGVIALVLGFVLYSILHSVGLAAIGAGDLKLISALVPFMWWRDAAEILLIFTIVIWIFLIFFVIAWKRIKRASNFAAMSQDEKKTFKLASPFGISLAATILIYLGRKVLETL